MALEQFPRTLLDIAGLALPADRRGVSPVRPGKTLGYDHSLRHYGEGCSALAGYDRKATHSAVKSRSTSMVRVLCAIAAHLASTEEMPYFTGIFEASGAP